jgi:hypothetical protein
MSDYEQQYYILRAAKGDQIPFLGPDEKTAERYFSFERQLVGSAPLVFRNMEREKNLAKRAQEVVGSILFHATNPLVNTSIRDALLELDVPNMYMHPAIYIDDRDKCHEDYWYVTFTELFDCWDRSLSDTSSSFVGTKGKECYDVYEYVLDKDLLDKTPLEKRLFFKMGGTIDAFVFCHESIARLFRRDMPNGARLVLAADY